MDSDLDIYKRHRKLVTRIGKILHGTPPEAAGIALADLTASWLAGHPDFLRAGLLEQHTDAIRQLTPINEHLFFGPAGHPSNQFPPGRS